MVAYGPGPQQKYPWYKKIKIFRDFFLPFSVLRFVAECSAGSGCVRPQRLRPPDLLVSAPHRPPPRQGVRRQCDLPPVSYSEVEV